MAASQRANETDLSRRQLLQRAGALTGGMALAQLGAACGSSSSATPARTAPPQKRSLNVGIIKSADMAPFWVAEQQGFFRQAGLTIRSLEFQTGAGVQEAIRAGQLDLGWSSVPTLVIAHLRGFNFQFFAGGAAVGPGQYANQSILVKSDSTIHSPTDIFGKKVGVPALGDIGELQVRWWLGRNGVDPRTVKLVQLNTTGAGELSPLMDGRVDAVHVSEPTVTAALKQGGVRSVGDWSFLSPAHLFLAGWVARGSWLGGNRITAKAFNNAIAMAGNAIALNRSAANKQISQKTGVSPAVAAAAILPQVEIPVTERDLNQLIAACRTYGLIKKSFAGSDVIWQTVM